MNDEQTELAPETANAQSGMSREDVSEITDVISLPKSEFNKKIAQWKRAGRAELEQQIAARDAEAQEQKLVEEKRYKQLLDDREQKLKEKDKLIQRIVLENVVTNALKTRPIRDDNPYIFEDTRQALLGSGMFRVNAQGEVETDDISVEAAIDKWFQPREHLLKPSRPSGTGTNPNSYQSRRETSPSEAEFRELSNAEFDKLTPTQQSQYIQSLKSRKEEIFPIRRPQRGRRPTLNNK